MANVNGSKGIQSNGSIVRFVIAERMQDGGEVLEELLLGVDKNEDGYTVVNFVPCDFEDTLPTGALTYDNLDAAKAMVDLLWLTCNVYTGVVIYVQTTNEAYIKTRYVDSVNLDGKMQQVIDNILTDTI